MTGRQAKTADDLKLLEVSKQLAAERDQYRAATGMAGLRRELERRRAARTAEIRARLRLLAAARGARDDVQQLELEVAP